MTILSPSELRKLLDHDSETGALTWKPRPASMFAGGKRSAEHSAANWNAKWAGKPALSASHNAGYLCGSIFGRRYLAHRVAWAIHHGSWPSDQIDHINGVRDDNRIKNLRECSNLQNCQNVRSHRDSTSSRAGVCRISRITSKPWLAQICVNGRQRRIGQFETEEAAIAARAIAERELHTFAHGEKCND